MPTPKLDDAYFAQNFNTPLSSAEAAAYQQWLGAERVRTGRDRSADAADYDMQGWFKATRGAPTGDARGHFPDTYKKPNHPTFSNQSQYHGAPAPWGGKWEGGQWASDGSTYTPSQTMLGHTHPKEWLQRYMRDREPNTRLQWPAP